MQNLPWKKMLHSISISTTIFSCTKYLLCTYFVSALRQNIEVEIYVLCPHGTIIRSLRSCKILSAMINTFQWIPHYKIVLKVKGLKLGAEIRRHLWLWVTEQYGHVYVLLFINWTELWRIDKMRFKVGRGKKQSEGYWKDWFLTHFSYLANISFWRYLG